MIEEEEEEEKGRFSKNLFLFYSKLINTIEFALLASSISQLVPQREANICADLQSCYGNYRNSFKRQNNL